MIGLYLTEVRLSELAASNDRTPCANLIIKAAQWLRTLPPQIQTTTFHEALQLSSKPTNKSSYLKFPLTRQSQLELDFLSYNQKQLYKLNVLMPKGVIEIQSFLWNEALRTFIQAPAHHEVVDKLMQSIYLEWEKRIQFMTNLPVKRKKA